MTRYGDIARLINGLRSPHGSIELHADFLFSLRNGFTAYFVLSPENGSLATVAGGTLPANLTPAPRRQDHTTSPYASAAFVSRSPQRPSHLTARS